ncbi:hypothetical protein GGG16DRAFT_49819 [Schizophyllum commune]
MSLANATDTGGSSQSAEPVTPARNRLSAVTSSLATDTPMSTGVGDPNYGYRVVKDLTVRLKSDLKRHHAQNAEIPRPLSDTRKRIERFLRDTPLYNCRVQRWVDVPVEPKDEKELYDPHTAIIKAIIDRFDLSNRRLIMAASITIRHDPHEREVLVTRPDYLIVGRGPLVNGRSRFGKKEDFDNEWALYDNATTVGDGKTEDNAAVLDNGLQLAVYARACFIQQCNRDFVYGFILTEKRFRVYIFDRCGMMSTVSVDYHSDPVPFVHAICLIASKDADAIGYNPTICYGKNEDGKLTRYLTSTFLRPRTEHDSDMENHVEEDDPDDGLAHISVDEVKYVEEKVTFCVHRKPLHVRRDLRGRGGVYWSADHKKWGAVLIKQAYVPVGRVPEWKYLKKAVGLTGVGQMLGYDTRSWKYSCVILKRYGKSVTEFKSRRQLLIAFRDAINGHWNLWRINILHRDVSIHNILLGLDEAEPGWEGVLIDLDMAISVLRKKSDLEVDFRTGTRAFQSCQVLQSCWSGLSSEPTSSSQPRLMHDYMDDLESFYWCLCWICFSFNGPKAGSQTGNKRLEKWQDDDPREAYDNKSAFLKAPLESTEVTPYFRRFIPLLERLQRLFRSTLNTKNKLVERNATHRRSLNVIKQESETHYKYVLDALQTLIDDPEVDVDMPQEAEEEDDMLDAFIALPDASSQEPRSTSRMLGPTSTSVSLGNKRKASEESDEAPEKKKAASTAPLIPSSLRHSESYDP